VKFKVGDLIMYGTKPHWKLPGVLGILMRKLQYETDDEAQNWDGKPAWWIHFVNDKAPMWSYEEELTLVSKGN
jgi:hypothetical protein